MDVRSLRIGNWFKLKKETSIDENIFSLDKHRLATLLLNNQINLIEPIPLTEEWLLKFGFRKVDSKGETHFNKRFFHWYSSTKSIVLEFDSGIGGEGYDFFMDNNGRYVHQLQNLYFALTGEELTIKDESM